MRSIIILVGIYFLCIGSSFGQSGYTKVHKLDKEIPGLARVETVSGTVGFIDAQGKTVIEPIYTKIENLELDSGILKVKTVAGTYGLIDLYGKEILKPEYLSISKLGKDWEGMFTLTSVGGTKEMCDEFGKIQVQ